jgi:hypothetical protein
MTWPFGKYFYSTRRQSFVTGCSNPFFLSQISLEIATVQLLRRVFCEDENSRRKLNGNLPEMKPSTSTLVNVVPLDPETDRFILEKEKEDIERYQEDLFYSRLFRENFGSMGEFPTSSPSFSPPLLPPTGSPSSNSSGSACGYEFETEIVSTIPTRKCPDPCYIAIQIPDVLTPRGMPSNSLRCGNRWR